MTKSSKSAPPTTTSRLAFASELAAAACGVLVVVGCGAAGPLLHPAHTLPAGDVTFGVGVSSGFVLGDADTQIDEARQLGSSPVAASQDQDYVEGVVAYIATPPGLTPWVGARAGVGFDSDAGVAYTGRAVRVDGRHAFESDATALSIGLGLTGLLLQGTDTRQKSTAIPGLDADGVTGFGADVPVIGGWRSDAELVSVWGGARGGFERSFGELFVPGAPEPERVDFEAMRWHLGGLVGLSIGVEPVRVAVELDVSWSRTSGTIDPKTNPAASRMNATVEAWTVVPAGAVIGRF